MRTYTLVDPRCGHKRRSRSYARLAKSPCTDCELIKFERTHKEIKLQTTADGIMAHYLVSGKPDEEVVRLFGTHIIPTAFTNACSMPRATLEIERLNPDYVVSSI